MGVIEFPFEYSTRQAEKRRAKKAREQLAGRTAKEVAEQKAASGTEEEYSDYYNKLTKELATAEKKSPHKLDVTTSSGEVITMDSPLVSELKQWLSSLESSRDRYLSTQELSKNINDIVAEANTPKQTLSENLIATPSIATPSIATPSIATPVPAEQTNYSSIVVIGIVAFLLFR